jgi:alkaline phosphatase
VGYLAADLKPYSTLGYANGPGSINGYVGGQRVDLTNVDTSNKFKNMNRCNAT